MPGGCAAGSLQEVWLKADLAANSTKNVIAIWHKPRYSSGATQYQAVQPLWDDLYAAGVDILLDGHDHIYERTAPMKSGATLASSPVADPDYGITQFTVGTGGEGHHGLVTPLPTSQVQDDTTFGDLQAHASCRRPTTGCSCRSQAARSRIRARVRCTPLRTRRG